MCAYIINGLKNINLEQINKLLESPFVEKFIFPLVEKFIFPLFLLILGSWLINRSIERYKHNNALELQAESFYKERSGSEIQEILMLWSDLVLDIEKVKGMLPEDFQKLLLKTFVYGSERTVNLISSYQQHNYKKAIDDNHNFKSLVYVAMISSSLKKDFTNQSVDPLQLLKIKITDYDDKMMRKHYKNIEKEITTVKK